MRSDEAPRMFWGELRTTFLRGFVVSIPVALTYWFFSALLSGIDGILSPILEGILGRKIPGLGFISMMVIILLVGLLSRNIAARVLLNAFEKLLQQIPFVRAVYGAIKDLVGALGVGGKGKSFREVVLIEYPRAGLYTIAFVTNEMPYVAMNNDQKNFVNVYIPNPPNPTSGLLILVPREQAVKVNLTIEQGLKLVLSGGIVVPEILQQAQ
jgi:uncharacterized membrane protein